MTSDVVLKAVDTYASSLNGTITIDNVDQYGIRVDRGIKIYTLGMPAVIGKIFGITQSMPTMITDFGKARLYLTINFTIDEGSLALNETKLIEWSEFIRVNCWQAAHVYLKIGDHINWMGEELAGSHTDGVEGKVLRLFARKNEGEEDLYCTLQFAHCIEIDLLGG